MSEYLRPWLGQYYSRVKAGGTIPLTSTVPRNKRRFLPNTNNLLGKQLSGVGVPSLLPLRSFSVPLSRRRHCFGSAGEVASFEMVWNATIVNLVLATLDLRTRWFRNGVAWKAGTCRCSYCVVVYGFVVVHRGQ